MNDADFFRKVDQTLASYRLLNDAQRAEIALQIGRGLSYEHALRQTANLEPALYRRVLEEVSGCLLVDPSQVAIDQEFITSILDVLPLKAIVALRIFPITLAGNTLTVAFLNPTDGGLLAELQSTTCLRINPVISTHLGLQSAIEQNFSQQLRPVLQELRGGQPDSVLKEIFEQRRAESIDIEYERFLSLVNRDLDRVSKDPEDLAHFIAHPLVVSYTQRLLTDVILRNCSDIHLEPGGATFRVRARINGGMRTLHELPRKCGDVVSMRVRAMAELDLGDGALPRDAQINYSPVFSRRIEFRVSVLPTIHGGKTVMRLLEKQNQSVGLDRIGLTDFDLERVRRNIASPNGLVLVTGPTGSGKTSTLYSILNVLNDEERCIVTAEEPVESEIPGVVQVACNEQRTFSMALRSFLRQDPDVIMVGEIRDQTTADIALKAALTGHLVLSTLHTNDAPTAVMRLLNLDMDPFVIASSLRLVVAQRLIRTLCEFCRKSVTREELLSRHLPAEIPEEGNFFARVGCSRCNETGYTGRIGVFEVLERTDEMADAIARRASLSEIRSIAERGGTRSLREHALMLVASGRTSVEEMIRVTAE